MGADKADVLIDCIVVMMPLIALLSSILLIFLDTWIYWYYITFDTANHSITQTLLNQSNKQSLRHCSISQTNNHSDKVITDTKQSYLWVCQSGRHRAVCNDCRGPVGSSALWPICLDNSTELDCSAPARGLGRLTADNTARHVPRSTTANSIINVCTNFTNSNASQALKTMKQLIYSLHYLAKYDMSLITWCKTPPIQRAEDWASRMLDWASRLLDWASRMLAKSLSLQDLAKQKLHEYGIRVHNKGPVFWSTVKTFQEKGLLESASNHYTWI